jgi:hypothetical protein
MVMDREQDKLAIEQKLARCRRLEADFPAGVTARHLQELEAELQRQLRELEEPAVRPTPSGTAVKR